MAPFPPMTPSFKMTLVVLFSKVPEIRTTAWMLGAGPFKIINKFGYGSATIPGLKSGGYLVQDESKLVVIGSIASVAEVEAYGIQCIFIDAVVAAIIGGISVGITGICGIIVTAIDALESPVVTFVQAVR